MNVLKSKMAKLSVPLMLSFAMVVTGCSKSTTESTDKSTTQPSAQATPAAATAKPAENSEISFMGWGGDTEKAVFQKLTDSYMQKYPTKKVKYTIVPPAEYAQKLETLVASGKAPDVFYAGEPLFQKLAGSGTLLKMDDLIKSSKSFEESNVWKKGLDRYRFDGKVLGKGSLYGLPKDVGPWAFAYNKDLFDKAGVKYPSAKAGEWTWNDMIEAAKKITTQGANGKTDVFGVAGYSLESAVWANGGDYIDYNTGTIKIDEPAFIEALQFVADLKLKYKVSPSPTDEKAQGGYARFVAGKIGMFPMGPWDQPGFWKLPFGWDIAAWPASPKTGKTATWLGSAGFVISSKTKFPEDAFNLAAYLSLDRDSQKENYQLGQAVPNLVDMAKGEFMKMDKAPANRQVFLDIIEDYGHSPIAAGSVDTKWLDTFNQEVSRVWEGKQTAEEWAKEMKPKLQELYDKGNKK
ncbi:sugar ABC transporter substrate-binding protein [Paenibacillus sp. 2RAB27]|uniref:ABC transporter substrate-binding protein n=1 Tax=Paenibacillus sp. 2RAB27 TaxID=3232991 RepID=UPI003F957096